MFYMQKRDKGLSCHPFIILLLYKNDEYQKNLIHAILET